jgi:hypothetical protein
MADGYRPGVYRWQHLVSHVMLSDHCDLRADPSQRYLRRVLVPGQIRLQTHYPGVPCPHDRVCLHRLFVSRHRTLRRIGFWLTLQLAECAGLAGRRGGFLQAMSWVLAE